MLVWGLLAPFAISYVALNKKVEMYIKIIVFAIFGVWGIFGILL